MMMWIAYILLLMSTFIGVLWVLARYEPVWAGLQDTTDYQRNVLAMLTLIYFIASITAAGADLLNL